MIRQDVVYALRTMRRDKLSSLVAVLVLALGIGSTATVFTLVNGMLLKRDMEAERVPAGSDAVSRRTHEMGIHGAGRDSGRDLRQGAGAECTACAGGAGGGHGGRGVPDAAPAYAAV